jgi:hypothetical protein
MKKQTLQPLYLRKPSIRSLAFDLTTRGRSFQIPDFAALNVSALEYLHLINTDEDMSIRLMDMALRSRSENFTLVLDTDMALVERLLRHRLLDRVVNLRIPFGKENLPIFIKTMISDLVCTALVPSFINSEPPRISLPHVKTCEVSCLPKLLCALDLCNAQTLAFEGTPTLAMLPIPVPSQLHSMRISRTCFRVLNISTHRPQCFSALTSLEIVEVRIEGNLRQHLILPNLKNLKLHDIKFIEVQEKCEDPEYRVMIQDLFLDIPTLQSLSLYRVEVGEGLVTSLQKSPLLQHLRLECCLAEEFIVSFAERLGTNRTSFAALQSFHVFDSWPESSNVPYEEFVQYCTVERPNLQVSGDASWVAEKRGPLVSAVDWMKGR